MDTHIHTHTRMHTHKDTNTHTKTHTHTHTRKHTHRNTHTQAHGYGHIHTHTPIDTDTEHTHTLTHTHTHTHTHGHASIHRDTQTGSLIAPGDSHHTGCFASSPAAIVLVGGGEFVYLMSPTSFPQPSSVHTLTSPSAISWGRYVDSGKLFLSISTLPHLLFCLIVGFKLHFRPFFYYLWEMLKNYHDSFTFPFFQSNLCG